MSTEQYGNPGLSGISLKPGKTGSTTRLGVTAGNVVSQLRRMILEGQFAHEERLPAERNLAEEFKVSQGAIVNKGDVLTVIT